MRIAKAVSQPSLDFSMRIYADLAPWFHLLTHPADYVEEADFAARVIEATVTGRRERCSSSARAEGTTRRI